MLTIKNLHVKLEDEDKQILKGVDLTVEAGRVHAIMGPNGSGKSTLSYVLSGRDGYEVTEGSATLEGEDLLAMENRFASLLERVLEGLDSRDATLHRRVALKLLPAAARMRKPVRSVG